MTFKILSTAERDAAARKLHESGNEALATLMRRGLYVQAEDGSYVHQALAAKRKAAANASATPVVRTLERGPYAAMPSNAPSVAPTLAVDDLADLVADLHDDDARAEQRAFDAMVASIPARPKAAPVNAHDLSDILSDLNDDGPKAA